MTDPSRDDTRPTSPNPGPGLYASGSGTATAADHAVAISGINTAPITIATTHQHHHGSAGSPPAPTRRGTRVLAGAGALVAALAAVATNVATADLPGWLVQPAWRAWLILGVLAMVAVVLAVVAARPNPTAAAPVLGYVDIESDPEPVPRPAELEDAVTALLGTTATRRPWSRRPWGRRPWGRALADRRRPDPDRAVGPVTICTSLQGVGGFGKTTLARMLLREPRIRRRFGAWVFWVTMGRDATRDVIIQRVAELVHRLGGGEITAASVEEATAALVTAVTGHPHTLLVVDDVWHADQVKPFTAAAATTLAVRVLVTTRSTTAVPGGTHVTVDRVTPEQASAILTRGLTGLSPATRDQLLTVLDGWPLILASVNRLLQHAAGPVEQEAHALLDTYQHGGTTALDELTAIDFSQPAATAPAHAAAAARAMLEDTHTRGLLVSATIDAGRTLLIPQHRPRLAELGIFAEDEHIPVDLVALLWAQTGHLDPPTSSRLLTRMADLGLLYLRRGATDTDTCHDGSPSRGRPGSVSLHDVYRDHLRHELDHTPAHPDPPDLTSADTPPDQPADPRPASGRAPRQTDHETRPQPGPHPPGGPQHRRVLNHDLLLAVSAQLAVADRPAAPRHPTRGEPARSKMRSGARAGTGSDTGLTGADWPRLPPAARYMRDNLAYHLRETGDLSAAEQVITNPRWLTSRLQHEGLPAVLADLQTLTTPPALALRRRLASSAHLLGPTDPLHAQAAILLSRIHDLLPHPDTNGNDPQGDHHHLQRPDHPAHADVGATRPPYLAPCLPLPDTPLPASRAVLSGHTSWVSGVAIAPDGTWLATTSNDQTVRIWDVVTGTERTRLTGHTGPVTGVAIAPDGTWLATTSNDQTVRIWDLVTGTERTRLTGHTDTVTGVAIAPDGTWLATTSNDQTVRIWDLVTGTERTRRSGHTGRVLGVAIAPDGTWLATTSNDETVRIWDVVTGTERTRLTGHTNTVSGVAIAPDGTWLATTSNDQTVRIWDLVTGTERTRLTGHTDTVTGVAIAPDGTWLATTSNDQTVRIWDLVTGTERTRLTGHTDTVTGVAIAPDGTWLATTSNDQTVRIWDLVTGTERTRRSGHTGRVLGVAIAPDGTWLATTSNDETVRIWDVVTGTERTRLTGHTNTVSGVAIAPDGTWLATTGRDGTVRIWDLVTGTERTRLSGHTNSVEAVAIAPDGTWLATTCWDATVRIWDPVTGTERTRLTGHTNGVSGVAIAPDGTWLATTSNDQTVRIWDVVTGTERTRLTGHTNGVTGVAIAPDGTWLATTSHDGTVRIWDLVSGTERTRLTGHTGRVTGVAIAPDGTWLATTSNDRTVRIWDPVVGSPITLMRVEDELACVACSSSTLFAGGRRGLYGFRLVRPAK